MGLKSDYIYIYISIYIYVDIDIDIQKQPPEVFCKKGVLRYFTKITRKDLCQSLVFNKVAGLMLHVDTNLGKLNVNLIIIG